MTIDLAVEFGTRENAIAVARETPDYLGGYRLLNVVHSSRACQIWQASDEISHRIVAIKVPRDGLAEKRDYVHGMRWEYTVGRKAIHPRIIEIYAFGTERGIPYLAMEWCDFPNMKHLILQGVENHALSIYKIINQAGEGLGMVLSPPTDLACGRICLC